MGDYPNTILLAQTLELYTLSQIWFYFEARGYDLYYWHISIDLYSNYILTVQFHCEYRGRVSGSVFIIFLLHWYCFKNCPALSALLTKGQSQCFWQKKELNEKQNISNNIVFLKSLQFCLTCLTIGFTKYISYIINLRKVHKIYWLHCPFEI